jgi:hypothetical protein
LNRRLSFKNKLTRLTITIFALGVLISAAAVIPLVSADANFNLSYSSGNTGASISFNVSGFTPGGTLTLTFDPGAAVAYSQPLDDQGNKVASFYVPTLAAGSYTITASDDQGVTAPVQNFEVTVPAPPPPANPTAPPASTPAPTPAPSSSDVPTDSPTDSQTDETETPTKTPTSTSGFDMTTLGIIGAVIAVIILVPVVMIISKKRGGRRGPSYGQEPEYPSGEAPFDPGAPGQAPMYQEPQPQYGPNPYAEPPPYNPPAYQPPPSRTPPRYGASSYGSSQAPPRYGSPASAGYRPSTYGASRAPSGSRYGAPSGYSGRSSMSTCPSCRRMVSGTAMTCPYCRARLR